MNLSLPCRGAAWHPQRRRTARCGRVCLLLSRYPSAGPRPCRAWVCSLPWSASSCRRPCRTWRRRRCPWGARRRRGVRRRLPGETCLRWAYLPRPCPPRRESWRLRGPRSSRWRRACQLSGRRVCSAWCRWWTSRGPLPSREAWSRALARVPSRVHAYCPRRLRSPSASRPRSSRACLRRGAP